MPKMTERDRLADLEARQRKIVEEVENARQALRERYAGIAAEAPIERLGEREFRDIVTHAIRAGGPASVQALKALPAVSAPSITSPERRPSDEHGGAARRRPASPKGAAASGDGPGQQPGP